MGAPISFLIERTPFASSYGDACLNAAGGYSIDLKFWWHIKFPTEVVLRTLRYLPDNKSGRLISINVLEFVLDIIDFCAALTVVMIEDVTGDPIEMYISTYLDNACLQIFKARKVIGDIILLPTHGFTLENKFQTDRHSQQLYC